MSPPKKLKVDNGKIESDTSLDCDSDGSDWRAGCSGIRDINAYALKKKLLTDVKFLVGAKKEIFQAHRLILALGSPVFEAMFYGLLAEKGDTITIPDIEPEGFHYLLKFLYSERAVFWDEHAAFKAAFAAEKYCVHSLKKRCESFLCSVELMPCKVWWFLQNSIYLNLIDLKVRCYNYLRHNADSALQHSMFLDVDSRTVETFLSRVDAKVSARKLLEYVINWAKHNSNAEVPDSFKNAIMPLLRHIHFGNMAAEEFIYFLDVKNLQDILETNDALAILKHTLLPKMCDLPDWCSKSKPLHASPPKYHGKRAFTFRCLFKNPESASQITSTSESSSGSSSSGSSSSDSSDTSE